MLGLQKIRIWLTIYTRWAKNVTFVEYIYKRPFLKPVIAAPLATEFNDVVAMDIKVYKNTCILHLINHVTMFSAAAIVKSKQEEEIIKNIFKIWISIYGPPLKYFSDNGGELSNENYNEMWEVYNITVKKTVAEVAFSNDLVEEQNAVLEDMLLKTCEDKNFSMEIALQWVINSKSSLTNVHGFSSYQLVFSFDPKLPNIFINTAPVLHEPNISKLIADKLNAMHSDKFFCNKWKFRDITCGDIKTSYSVCFRKK